jgi:acyl carrier protein
MGGMDGKTIEEKMRAMIAEQFEVGVEEITPEVMLFQEFKVDSLDILDLVMMIQKQFGVKIRDEDLETLTTLRGFVNYIAARLPQGV